MKYYQLTLDVYQTTKEVGYAGGNDIITKKFDTLEEASKWKNDYESNIANSQLDYWIEHQFPQVLSTKKMRLYEITKVEIESN